jgi:hypothetical protein
MMSKINSKATESQKMQSSDQRQSVKMEGVSAFGLCSVIRWRRDWCLSIRWNRHHKLNSLSEVATSFLSLAYPPLSSYEMPSILLSCVKMVNTERLMVLRVGMMVLAQ